MKPRPPGVIQPCLSVTPNNFCSLKLRLILAVPVQRPSGLLDDGWQTLGCRFMAERWCQHISAVHLLALERSSDIKTFPVVLELSHSAWCGSHSLLQSAFLFFSQPVRQKLFFPQCPDKRSLSSSASICPCWILSTSLYGGGCSQLNLQSGASGLSWLYNGGARLISMSVLSTMTINSGDASGQTWLSWESSYEGGKELSLQGKRDIWCIVSYIYKQTTNWDI